MGKSRVFRNSWRFSARRRSLADPDRCCLRPLRTAHRVLTVERGRAIHLHAVLTADRRSESDHASPSRRRVLGAADEPHPARGEGPLQPVALRRRLGDRAAAGDDGGVHAGVLRGWRRCRPDGAPYPLFAYAALVPWFFFSNSVNSGTMSLITYRNIVTKTYFPREIVPLAQVVLAPGRLRRRRGAVRAADGRITASASAPWAALVPVFFVLLIAVHGRRDVGDVGDQRVLPRRQSGRADRAAAVAVSHAGRVSAVGGAANVSAVLSAESAERRSSKGCARCWCSAARPTGTLSPSPRRMIVALLFARRAGHVQAHGQVFRGCHLGSADVDRDSTRARHQALSRRPLAHGRRSGRVERRRPARQGAARCTARRAGKIDAHDLRRCDDVTLRRAGRARASASSAATAPARRRC